MRDRARLADSLEVIKFLCKDFWLAVFKKQVDNLRTNHRASCGHGNETREICTPALHPPHRPFAPNQGVFVLSDSNFRWLQRLPTMVSAGQVPEQEEAIRQQALLHLHLPCGIIAGKSGCFVCLQGTI